MGLLSRLKGWFSLFFQNQAEMDFDVQSITSSEMERIIDVCASIYQGHPGWVDPGRNIKTINFAKSVCSETARLTTLAIGISIDGSERAEFLQKQIDNVYTKIRAWVEYGCAFGTVILKPNGETVDVVLPSDFIPTDKGDTGITGAVFRNKAVSPNGKKFYTRLEFHRFLEDGKYEISNTCYSSENPNDLGEKTSIEATPWAGLAEDIIIENLEKPLFSVLRMPHANNVDVDSPLSLPCFWDAIEELKDLDIAYSRNAIEIAESSRTVLLDSDCLIPTGEKINKWDSYFSSRMHEMQLPPFIKNVQGDGAERFYQEINPSLNTDERLKGINALLSQIGYKCGYSNGYFVFNETTGIQTATGVEAEQQRTIQFIKDMRDSLQFAMDGLIYSLDKFASLYGYAPEGEYEVSYNFGDITYDYETDRAMWYSYVTAGRVPFWYFLVKFEGLSEKAAKELAQEAEPKEPGFFQDGDDAGT